MKTDIHIQHELDVENGKGSIRFEANVRDTNRLIDKTAAVITTLAEGIKSFAEDHGIPISVMATVLLNGMGCMTDEDANEAIDILCAGGETEDTAADGWKEEKDESPCVDNIDALKKAVDELFDKLYEKK